MSRLPTNETYINGMFYIFYEKIKITVAPSLTFFTTLNNTITLAGHINVLLLT